LRLKLTKFGGVRFEQRIIPREPPGYFSKKYLGGPVETKRQLSEPEREDKAIVQCTQQCVENMRETGWSPIYCRR
jgi:hypothetical protein